MSSAAKLSFVSLFSGAGGLDLGFESAGFQLLLANDNDAFCAKTHSNNFPHASFFEGSVADLSSKVGRSLIGPQTVDVLVGGPPCPPFSKSRFYRKEKPRALDDPLGWETMSGYLDVLAWVKPRAFVLENVPGLAYKVHSDALDFITTSAADLGYDTSFRILNAADYGVPQTRERLFVVGTRDREFQWPAPTHARTPVKRQRPWKTAGEAIGSLPSITLDHTLEGHFAGGKHHELLQQIPPGDNYLFFTAKRGHSEPVFEWRSRYWSFLLKLSPQLPSWTIQARRSNNMGPFHWNNRILTIDEVKALQTFPRGWFLAGNVEQQWRQVGNAVPPLLAKALARALKRTLQS